MRDRSASPPAGSAQGTAAGSNETGPTPICPSCVVQDPRLRLCPVHAAQGAAETAMQQELRAYLDTLAIDSHNIGDIRRSLFVPWESAWNALVRDETAERERPAASVPSPSGAEDAWMWIPTDGCECPACEFVRLRQPVASPPPPAVPVAPEKKNEILELVIQLRSRLASVIDLNDAAECAVFDRLLDRLRDAALSSPSIPSEK